MAKKPAKKPTKKATKKATKKGPNPGPKITKTRKKPEAVTTPEATATGTERYEWIRATVEDGTLEIKYQVRGLTVSGSTTHDEDVSDYSRKEIETLIKQLLDIEADDPVNIELDY